MFKNKSADHQFLSKICVAINLIIFYSRDESYESELAHRLQTQQLPNYLIGFNTRAI